MEKMETPQSKHIIRSNLWALVIASILSASCTNLDEETEKLDNMMYEYQQVAIEHNAQVEVQQEWCDPSINTEIEASWEWLDGLNKSIKSQKEKVKKLQEKEAKKKRESWGIWNWTNHNQKYDEGKYDYRKEYLKRAAEQKAKLWIKNSQR